MSVGRRQRRQSSGVLSAPSGQVSTIAKRVVGATNQTARVPTTMSLSTERPAKRASQLTAAKPHDSAIEQRDAYGLDEVDSGPDAAWSIISYILSGILFWGLLGWWLDGLVFDPSSDTTLFLPTGVLIGTAAGGYLGYMRFLQRTQRPDL